MRTISGTRCGPFYYGAPSNRSAAPGLVINSQPTVPSMLCSDHGQAASYRFVRTPISSVLDFLTRCRLLITNPPKLPMTSFLDSFQVGCPPPFRIALRWCSDRSGRWNERFDCHKIESALFVDLGNAMNRDTPVDSAISDYREFPLSSPLASYLLCLWTQRIVGSGREFAQRVLPDG